MVIQVFRIFWIFLNFAKPLIKKHPVWTPITATYRLCLAVPCWTSPAGTPCAHRPRSRPVWCGSNGQAAPATGERWPLLVSRGAWSSQARRQRRRCPAWNDKHQRLLFAQQTTIALVLFQQTPDVYCIRCYYEFIVSLLLNFNWFSLLVGYLVVYLFINY